MHAPGQPSMIGCQQAQEFGIITVNNFDKFTSNHVQDVAQKGNLTGSRVLSHYLDCFDKVGRFPEEKYHFQLIDNPLPVIHPPRTAPVHILPDDVIVEVTEPTDWMNSIVCNIRESLDGKTNVRLCLDPKDLNNNIRRQHYYSRTIDELLPLFRGRKYFSVIDNNNNINNQFNNNTLQYKLNYMVK